MGKSAWLGIVVAMMVAGAAKAAPATEALIGEAQAALDKGDAVHAASLADTGLGDAAVSPVERGRLFLYRGLAEELLGSHDPAMRDFTAALETRALAVEEREQALLQRGFLRDGLGRLDEAVTDYSAVIALKGGNLATALNNRANIYRRQNRLADARRDYRAALSAAGGKPQYAWYGLGQIAEAEADKAAARGFYAKAVAADPNYALASDRLEALGGPPDDVIASAQDRIVLHPPPPAVAPGIAPTGVSAGRSSGTVKALLRPALDQLGRAGESGSQGIEVQLGAWRSEGEANAGWNQARLRAAGALDAFSPHIVTADLPGKGRYYRLRVRVTTGQNQTGFCAGLSAKGIACVPARD